MRDATAAGGVNRRRLRGNLEVGHARPRSMRRITILLVIGIALASCASGVSAPSRAAGVLSGVVTGHLSGGTKQSPLAGVHIGVFREAVFSGGPIRVNAPKPVATATTDGHGTFTIHGLAAGRWFVLAMDQAGGGAWVRFDPATGAVVTLVVCTDCPVPL